jgi:hypothetical protein
MKRHTLELLTAVVALATALVTLVAVVLGVLA